MLQCLEMIFNGPHVTQFNFQVTYIVTKNHYIITPHLAK